MQQPYVVPLVEVEPLVVLEEVEQGFGLQVLDSTNLPLEQPWS